MVRGSWVNGSERGRERRGERVSNVVLCEFILASPLYFYRYEPVYYRILPYIPPPPTTVTYRYLYTTVFYRMYRRYLSS